jgi:hypothetical protein
MASDILQFIFYRIVIIPLETRGIINGLSQVSLKKWVSKKLFLPNTRKKYTEEENIKIYLKKFGAPFTVMAGFWQ